MNSVIIFKVVNVYLSASLQLELVRVSAPVLRQPTKGILKGKHGKSISDLGLNVFKELFERAAEGLIVSDREGIILLTNPRTDEMFGYEHMELIGQKVEILIPEKLHDQHVNHRGDYNKTPKRRPMGKGMSLWGKKKNGELLPLEISLSHFGKGKDMKTMALINDITNRKQIEEKLLRLNQNLEKRVKQRTKELVNSQELYIAIARNFPDGTISVFDRDLNYVFFEGKELYEAGIDSAEIIGTSIKERLPKDVKDRVVEHLENVFEGKSGTIHFETRMNHYELNAVPLFEEDGNISQILMVERNITAQKNAQDNILAALEKERSLNELKSRFVSMASHEFRTPLTTILSSVSLIDRYMDGTDDKVNKHINRIKSSVQNLTSILNDFLSLDKLEEGKVWSKPSAIDVNELGKDVVDEMDHILKKGQVIEYRYSGPKGTVQLDGQIIRNILINLMSNAIKYSNEGQEIVLDMVMSGKDLTLEVIDQGIGIPEDEQHQLFERFFRAKNVTNIGGTGLGLNIVKKYTDLMDGDITFSSKSGKGTRFTIIIPLNQSQ